MKESILQLRSRGKTYNEIAQEVGCAKSTVAYYCNPEVELKAKVRQKANPNRRVVKAASRFRTRDNKNFSKAALTPDELATKDVLDMIGHDPRCYLSGVPIDLLESRSWALDHVTPVARGGTNELSNMRLASYTANMMKGTLLLSELLVQCQLILENNGYDVIKN